MYHKRVAVAIAGIGSKRNPPGGESLTDGLLQSGCGLLLPAYYCMDGVAYHLMSFPKDGISVPNRGVKFQVRKTAPVREPRRMQVLDVGYQPAATADPRVGYGSEFPQARV